MSPLHQQETSINQDRQLGTFPMFIGLLRLWKKPSLNSRQASPLEEEEKMNERYDQSHKNSCKTVGVPFSGPRLPCLMTIRYLRSRGQSYDNAAASRKHSDRCSHRKGHSCSLVYFGLKAPDALSFFFVVILHVFIKLIGWAITIYKCSP